MRESQYIDQYLTCAKEFGYTPSTFLAYNLKGKARKYSDVYYRALMTAIKRRLKNGSVKKVKSVGGKIAFILVDDYEN